MVVAGFTTADWLDGVTTGVDESDSQNETDNRLTLPEQARQLELWAIAHDARVEAAIVHRRVSVVTQ